MSVDLSYYVIRSGHFLEKFNNSLYGFFAVMLSSLYFPSSHVLESICYSYIAFAAAYLSRPLGAFFWGKIGDNFGRKNALLYSVTLSGVPTLCIGCLPTYPSIGIFAPMLLLTFRTLQGLCDAGEGTGISLYIYENRKKKSKKNKFLGLESCYITAFGVLGAALAAYIGSFVTLPMIPRWGWRIPFFVGGSLTLGLYFFKKHFLETMEYIQNKAQTTLQQKKPSLRSLMHYTPQIILTALLGALMACPLYGSTIFGNELFKKWGFSNSQSLFLNGSTFLLDAIFLLFFGYGSKILGLKRQLIFGLCALIILPFFAFYIITGEHISFFQAILFIIILTFSGATIAGYAITYVAKFFPVELRYSCITIGDNLGMFFIAGNTPLIFQYLINSLGLMGPPVFIAIIACLCLFMLWTVEHNFHKKYATKNHFISQHFSHKV